MTTTKHSLEIARPEDSALAQFRASNPQVRSAQDAQSSEFKEKFRRLVSGGIPLPKLLHEFIDKAEQSRQIGIVLIEFSDTLTGKRLTRDFYEQAADLFTDPATNQPVAFELLEWFIRVARNNPEPINSFKQVAACQQLLLLASGEDQFALEAESQRPPPVQHAPSNPLSEFKSFFRGAELTKTLLELRSNPGYCPNGRLRPDLRDTLRVELAPELKRFDEAREFVRAELGV